MGLNYDLGNKSENFRRMNHFKKLNNVNRIFFAENARFFQYNVHILALKIGDNLMIWDALYNSQINEGGKA